MRPSLLQEVHDPKFQARFWSKVDKGDSCWVWRSKSGVYFPNPRHVVRPNLISFILAAGRFPIEGSYVCQTCGNIRCVRPDHLIERTRAEQARYLLVNGRANLETLAKARRCRWERSQKRWEGATKKPCTRCKIEQPLDNFYIGAGVLGRSSWCKVCHNLVTELWVKVHPDIKSEHRDRCYTKAKSMVYDHYGRLCSCCGESEYLFLTLDHVNNDGGGNKRAIRGYAFYRSIIEAGYPDTYRILCWNCNSGRARNAGVCPHEFHRAYPWIMEQLNEIDAALDRLI